MINTNNQDYLNEVRQFAESTGRTEQFEQKIAQLESLAKNLGDGVVHLHPDFAPHSFTFTILNNGQHVLNGGLIFHGTHDRGGDGGSPTFSVNLTPVDGWAIHT